MEETPEKKPIGVYGPNDKPKGVATIIPDEPVEIFPIDNGDPDKPTIESD